MSSSLRLNPAVFLDRDGTLNVDRDYVHLPDQWIWIPGAINAVKGFNQLGFRVVVVTNQAGVARGLYTEADVENLHRYIQKDLAAKGAVVDAFYFCPHHADCGPIRDCDCRKPKPGMLLRAQRDLGLDMARSYMVGDKLIDLEAGRAAGVSPILVTTGYGASEKNRVPSGTPVVADVAGALAFVRRQGGL